MLKHIIAAAAIGVTSAAAYPAQDTAKMQPAATQTTATTQTSIPQNAMTVTDWYKQDVFDPNDNKIDRSRTSWWTSPARSTR